MAPPQAQHLHPLLEPHPQPGAGPLQGAHQPAAVVDLAVLFKQQARLPALADAGNLLFQAAAIEPLAEGGGGIGIPLRRGGEGHHDAAGPQTAAQAAVGFDLGHPGGDELQAGLPQGE